MRVLITDGDERAALAAARSLVAAGHDVHVIARRRFSLAGVARGVTPHALRAEALGNPAGYATEVARLARALEVGLLVPVTDPSVDALLERRDAFPPSLVLPCPDLVTYRAASDKLGMLERAVAAGLAAPDTVVIRGPRGGNLPGPDFFPAVLKPHRSVVPGLGSNGAKSKLGVWVTSDRAQCRAIVDSVPCGAFPLLLQRRIHGAGEGVFVLRWRGRIIAEFAHRRLREKPPSGGVSVYRESIALDPELAAAARRLLDGLDWHGVAMVECKRDDITGRPVFLEVNGRFWGSLQLAIDAGVDFPALLAAAALGEQPAAITGYRVGVRSRWLWGDVDHLYLRFKNRDAPLAALREFVRFRRHVDREEIWRWRDPAPFILETLDRLRPWS